MFVDEENYRAVAGQVVSLTGGRPKSAWRSGKPELIGFEIADDPRYTGILSIVHRLE